MATDGQGTPDADRRMRLRFSGRRRPRVRRARAGGQATLELVLIMPLMTAMLLAVLQVALLGVSRLNVAHAAREGAREAAVTADVEVVSDTVRRAIAGGGDVDALDVDVSRGRRVGDTVSVTVTYNARPQVPLVGPLFPDSVALRAVATMRVEVP